MIFEQTPFPRSSLADQTLRLFRASLNLSVYRNKTVAGAGKRDA
jgi:hypothetical protein